MISGGVITGIDGSCIAPVSTEGLATTGVIALGFEAGARFAAVLVFGFDGVLLALLVAGLVAAALAAVVLVVAARAGALLVVAFAASDFAGLFRVGAVVF